MSETKSAQKKKRRQQSKEVFISQLQTIGQMQTFYIQDWRISQNVENSLPTVKEKPKKILKRQKQKSISRVYESLPRIIPNFVQQEQKLKNCSSLHNLDTYRQVLPQLKSQRSQQLPKRKQSQLKQIQKSCMLSQLRPRMGNYSSHQYVRKKNTPQKQQKKLKTQQRNKNQLRMNELTLNTKVSSVLEILKKYKQESITARFNSSRKKIVQILSQNKINRIMRLKTNQKPNQLQQAINFFISVNKN